MIAREEVLAKAGGQPDANPTATATAAGAVSWSFASPPATPASSTSSAAIVIVVPGSGMDTLQRYEYTGRELASQSGQYFFRHRVYGPALGQFFTRDPLGYVDGMGLYAGVFADTLGLDPRGTAFQVVINPPSLAQCLNNILDLIARDKDIQGTLAEIRNKKCPGPIFGCICCNNKKIADEWGWSGRNCWAQLPKTNPGLLGPGTALTNPLRIACCADRMASRPDDYKGNFWHELVHYSQYCGLTQDQIDTEPCDRRLCNELQACNVTGACDPGSALWAQFGHNREDCLANAAAGSTLGFRRCPTDQATLSQMARKLIPACAGNKK